MRENKKKSDKCPVCNEETESRDHYNYKYKEISTFFKEITKLIWKQQLKKYEWMLKGSQEEYIQITTIATSHLIHHCERYSIDNNSRKRTFIATKNSETSKRNDTNI